MDPREERKKLGLDPHLPTGIVLFGYGTSKMQKILRHIDALPSSAAYFDCGRNEKLTQALRP